MDPRSDDWRRFHGIFDVVLPGIEGEADAQLPAIVSHDLASREDKEVAGSGRKSNAVEFKSKR
jgi:hypothetical protein